MYAETSELRIELAAWRERLVSRLMYASLPVGLLAVIAGLNNVLPEGDFFRAIAYVFAYLILLTVALVRRLPYALRSAVLLFLIYGLGLLGLMDSGLSSDGRVFLLTFPIVATVLLDWKMGLVSLVLSIATLVTVGWAMITGISAITVQDMANSTDLGAWFSGSVILLLMAVVILVPLSHLLRGQMFAIKFSQQNQALKETQSALEATNEQLQLELTDRVRAEEALKESEEKYRLVVETAHECILVAQDGMLRFFNSKAVEFFGHTPDELTTKPFVEFIHPDDRNLVLQRHIKRLKGEEVPSAYVFRVIHKSGELKWVEINVAVITWEGKPATLNFLSDITQRKQAQKRLAEKAEELARSNALIAALGQVAARIATTPDPDQIMKTLGDELEQLGINCLVILPEPDEQGLALRYISIESTVLRLAEKLIGVTAQDWRIPRHKWSNYEEVIDHKRPVFAEDMVSVAADLFSPIPRSLVERAARLVGVTPGTTAIYLPLVVAEQTKGVLTVWGPALHESDVPALLVFANQVAVALENACLYEESQRRLAEQTALREAITVISSTLDLDSVLSQIAKRMGQTIDATSAYISGFEPERMTATVLAEYFSPYACPEERVSDLGVSYAEDDVQFLETLLNQPFIAQLDNPDLPQSERDHMRQYGAQTVLYIPLHIGGEPIGYAELWESRRQREFTPEEIALCQGIGHQAAIAIENARLYQHAQQEIAERRRAEEKTNASLQEKEVLLKEIHHRVKNNLQVISSLLNLQSDYVNDQHALDIFHDSQHRIRSIALIHEKLYGSDNLAQIDFAEYVRDLVAYLSRVHGANARGISLTVHAQDIFLDINTAVPCGLILNELVSNCLKHAFPFSQDTLPGGDRLSGPGKRLEEDRPLARGDEIHIELSTNDAHQLALTVADNGVGFPEDMDFRNTTSLGLQLVNTLVAQLDGTIQLGNGQGTKFRITYSELP